MVSDPVEKRICGQCGTAVGTEDRFCQACGAATTATARHTCAQCGAALRPAARFCPRCGAAAGAVRRPGVRTAWDRVRARAAATDWSHVARIALPVAALLLAILVGFAIGRGTNGRATGPNQVVSAARSYRSAAMPGSGRGIPAEPAGASAAVPPVAPSAPLSHPLRFRDFRISASSYELANPPTLAADGDPYTAWHAWETERYSEGDWLTLTFPTLRLVTRIGLIPGRVGPRAGVDGSVRSILVKAPGYSPQKLIFADRAQMQFRNLRQPMLTRELTLRIVTVLPGSKSRHIIIPEVQVWGYPAPSRTALRPSQ